MKKLNAVIKYVLLALFFSLIVNTTDAQKLPKVQEVSLRAPDNIKIDGKATEWDNKFQAYNKVTSVFYTVTNDDNSLYLVIQAKDPLIINKILAGGITFTINNLGKNDRDGISITYPIFDKNDKPSVNLRDKPKIKLASAASVMHADSFMNTNNRRLTNKSKYIRVIGIKTLDTLISVYNDKGIRAVALFDNTMAYTYEIAIPLKYLTITGIDPTKFSYNIKLNGAPFDNLNGITQKFDATGKFTGIVIARGAIVPSPGEANAFISPTDFWGEYTLAKK